MSTKDYFSGQSKIYAAFRPTYPQELYQFIFQHLKNRSAAWDCATGNGQVARYLSEHFETVYATDISRQQIDNAFQANNIHYSVSKAEQTSFPDAQTGGAGVPRYSLPVSTRTSARIQAHRKLGPPPIYRLPGVMVSNTEVYPGAQAGSGCSLHKSASETLEGRRN
jgi:hypothetical protein